MEYNVKLPGPVSLLKESWGMYMAKFSPLMKISLIIFLVTVALEIIFPQKEVAGQPLFSFGYFIGSLVVGIISLLCSIAMIYVINNSWGVKKSLSRSPKVFWRYTLTSLLAGLIIFGGFLLLIVPGIIFAAWYALAALVVILEDLKGMDALRKSKEYVRGHVGEIIVRWAFIAVVLFIVIAVPSAVLASTSNLIANFFIALAFLFVYPLIEIYVYLVYTHLKKIHSNQLAPVISV